MRRGIATLTRQHADFTTRIEAVVAMLEASLTHASDLSEIFAGELSSLLADLTRHESCETRLFQRATFADLGGFD